MSEVKEIVERIAKAARNASRKVAALSSDQRNGALHAMAKALVDRNEEICAANKKDMEAGRANGLDAALLDRLFLDEKRIKGVAEGLREIAALPNPVGEISDMKIRPNGLRVGKMRVPLGVIGIIYESRPNVTADVAALCLKSGNAVILRGGKEAIHSNSAIAAILSDAIVAEGLPAEAIQLVPVTDREAVLHMMKQERYIDLIVPRGGFALIQFVTEKSLIPVVKHDKGVCHLYIDKDADLEMAVEITFNSKVQRPGVCNSLEGLLIHSDVASSHLPKIAEKLIEAGVEIRGCEKTVALVPAAKPATDEDWGTEFLDLILAVKVVDDYDGAIDYIAEYGSGHTETIVTENYKTAMQFVTEVDSSAVMVNASTRFNDGGQFGLGAEVGISTQKLHARGPMGIFDLTCQKWIVLGDGQIRQ